MTKPRTTRDEETRDMDLMEEYNFEYANPFDLPRGVYREGYSFHWGRTAFQGVNTYDYRTEELLRKGWQLVPKDRTTDKLLDPLVGKNPLSEKYICTFNKVLMERREEYKEREINARDRRTQDITKSLAGIGYTDLNAKIGIPQTRRVF